jgi:hypothetical protein
MVGLEFIPNVRDIDLLIYHEDAGIFLVEVKAVPISEIEEFGFRNCKIKGRDNSESPQLQARGATFSLKNYLYGKIESKSWIVPTVCWPKITRREWNMNWGEEEIKGEFSDRMLFYDDLHSTTKILIDRLNYIWFNPPIRTGPSSKFQHKENFFEQFHKAITHTYSSYKRTAIVSDTEKLRILEKTISNETKKEVPYDKKIRLVYSGLPGTGKTFRLLQIALYHITNNKNVLFVCYNKTLAADIRRILSYSDLVKYSKGNLQIMDIFDLLTNTATQNNLEYLASEAEYDEWASLIIEELAKNHENIYKYDTILVDESQDLKDWAFQFLDLFCNSNTSMVFANGKGQELYSENSHYLVELLKDQKISKRLNRNFRNTLPIFRLSQLVYETKMKISKIDSVIQQKFKTKSIAIDSDNLIFDRSEGDFPQLFYVDESEMNWEDAGSSFFPDEQERVMSEQYARIIQRQVDNLGENESFLDILILVPSPNSSESKWAKLALEKLNLPFIDYTDEMKRRTISTPEKIRLCTYHSSRGLEGMRVVIFGLEYIDKLTAKLDIKIENLGFIVLSRSVFDTVLAIRTKFPTEPQRFIQTAIEKLKNL